MLNHLSSMRANLTASKSPMVTIERARVVELIDEIVTLRANSVACAETPVHLPPSDFAAPVADREAVAGRWRDASEPFTDAELAEWRISAERENWGAHRESLRRFIATIDRLSDSLESSRSALWECARIAGADIEGDRTYRVLVQPTVEEFALSAVRELREDIDA